MKTKLTNFLMLVIMMTMIISGTSCSKDDDEKTSGGLAGSRWEFTDKYIDGSAEYVISFIDSSNATFEGVVRNAGGVIVDNILVRYTYRVSENLIVFSTEQAGKANLEGEIFSEIKMVVTNMSSGEEIGVFYRK